MTEKHKSAVESLIIVFSLVAYLTIKLVPSLVPAQYPINETLLLQILFGTTFIFTVSGLIEYYGKSSEDKDVHEIAHMFKLLAYPVLAFILLNTLHVSIGNLLIGAGFLGIIVGLAAQTSLGNVFAGMVILYTRPFKVGDKITFVPQFYPVMEASYPHEPALTSITGTVKHIGIVYTRIIRDDLSTIFIPNAILNTGLIQNQSKENEKMIRIRLQVPRRTNVELLKETLVSILSKSADQYEKIRDLDIKTALVSTENDLGIIIIGRVKVLEYDLMSQWLNDSAIKALHETEKIAKQLDEMKQKENIMQKRKRRK